jgi:uncharacterized membrane protein required for colicin V production
MVRIVIVTYLSLVLVVMAIPSKQASAATKTTPTTTSTSPNTRQRQHQQQQQQLNGNQWWIYRLRQQQQKLLQQQERFLKQLRQSDSNRYNQNSNNRTTITTSVVQIVETEYLDEYTGRWTALQNGTYCSKSRSDDENDGKESPYKKEDMIMVPQWTDAMTGEPVVAPSEYVLCNDRNQNQTWVGEWKIAVTSSSQSGWEYSRRRGRPKQAQAPAVVNTKRRMSPLLQYTHRQRIWLRTIATTTIDSGGTPQQQSIKVSKQKNKKKRRNTNLYVRMIEAIQEDWNFKGFGMTFVKSVLYRNAFGFAFRIPMTLHFKTWERYPALPNIGSSIAIFLPQLCICLFINLSFRVEYIQMGLYYISRIIPSLCTALLLLLLRGLALAVSALLYPLTRQPLLLANIQEYDDNDINNRNALWDLLLPKYTALYQLRRHPESDERIDVTWSFRWSLDRGYEFRTTCSHFYAVPLATVIEAMIPILPMSENKLTIYSTTSIMKLMDWIPRHEAAIGCSFVGPAYHDKTGLFITANTLLSLSGIYFTKQPKIRNGWKTIATKSEAQSSHDDNSILNTGGTDGSEVSAFDNKKTTRKDPLYDDDPPSDSNYAFQGNATSLLLSKTAAKLTNAKVVVSN